MGVSTVKESEKVSVLESKWIEASLKISDAKNGERFITIDGRQLNILTINEDSRYCQILSSRAKRAVVVASGERLEHLGQSLIFEYDYNDKPILKQRLSSYENDILSSIVLVYGKKVSTKVIFENKIRAIKSNMENICESNIVRSQTDTSELIFERILVKSAAAGSNGDTVEVLEPASCLLFRKEFIQIDDLDLAANTYALDITNMSMLAISGDSYRRIKPEEITELEFLYYANGFYRQLAIASKISPV